MKNRRLFLALALTLCSLISAPASVLAKDEWLRVRTKNFNLVGNAPEKEIRKVATKLEQFRETFSQLFKNARLNSPIPTNVVVFKSAGAYKPFQPKRADGKTDTNIAGYFQPGEDVNYITLSTEGEDADTYGTIFHEYVHFIVNASYGKSEVPPWFNEGLAEYYQTFEIKDDQKVNLGYPQREHLYLLNQTKMIPLETLFKISNYALHQNGNHSRSIFYAQSWALIHYLLQNGKSESLGKFLSLSLQNVAPEKAFQEAFQTTYAQMEKDLRKYVDQNTYKYQTVTFNNKLVFDNEMQVSPLGEADANAYLGDLLYHTNRADDAEPFLQKAVALAPNSGLANTTLGMLKIRQRKFEEAKTFLEKALAEDQKNHLAYYRYAYLLSREGRDEFGYVSSFPADKSVRMREMLKKAIAVNPAYTESYELLAFVNLVNEEQLDEAVAYLRKALNYQPGNQRYTMRIAEIYMRQDKYAEAAAILDKIAQTTDEPGIKAQAENLAGQLKQRRQFAENRRESGGGGGSRENSMISSSPASGDRPTLNRRESAEKTQTPEETAKMLADAKLRWVNKSLKKAATGEKQVIGRILKIECQGKNITYTVKTDAETFTLSSKDFESLAITAYVTDTEDVQVGCGAKVEDFNKVLTFKTSSGGTKSGNRGELIAVDFVPENFRFMEAADLENETGSGFSNSPPPPPAAPENAQEVDARRREAMLQGIKNALRKPLEGEIRELGFVEKIECTSKGMLFYFKTQTQALKLSAASPQAIQMRAFTPDVEQVRFGCGLKQLDVPAVITYKIDASLLAQAPGVLVAMEFVPKSFVLEK